MSTPLHPAIVHFPIVLVVLLPIVALAATLLLRRGGSAVRGWVPVVLVAAALAASSWAAVETGEAEEDAVEEVVPRSAIHEHEERAEVFFPLTVVLLAIAGAGLAPGRAASAARWTTVAAAVVVAVLGLRLGHSGGELVYTYGAGAAYAQSATDASLPNGETAERGGDEGPERHR